VALTNTAHLTCNSNQAAFLGDPNFPMVAMRSSRGGKIRLYESLYRTYSRLKFTRISDRPIAIAGLEQRLVAAFDTHGGYGVFERPFFGRSLLWKRDEASGRPMTPIVFPPGQEYRVPSWSWMAYVGAVEFMDLPFDGVEWLHEHEEYSIRSPWAAAMATAATAATTRTTPASSSSSFASAMSNKTWHTGDASGRTYLQAVARAVRSTRGRLNIIRDADTRLASYAREGGKEAVLREWERVVVVGRRKPSRKGADVASLEHFVLVVQPRRKPGEKGSAPRDSGGYERVGVGSVPGDCVVGSRPFNIRVY